MRLFFPCFLESAKARSGDSHVESFLPAAFRPGKTAKPGSASKWNTTSLLGEDSFVRVSSFSLGNCKENDSALETTLEASAKAENTLSNNRHSSTCFFTCSYLFIFVLAPCLLRCACTLPVCTHLRFPNQTNRWLSATAPADHRSAGPAAGNCSSRRAR